MKYESEKYTPERYGWVQNPRFRDVLHLGGGWAVTRPCRTAVDRSCLPRAGGRVAAGRRQAASGGQVAARPCGVKGARSPPAPSGQADGSRLTLGSCGWRRVATGPCGVGVDRSLKALCFGTYFCLCLYCGLHSIIAFCFPERTTRIFVVALSFCGLWYRGRPSELFIFL